MCAGLLSHLLHPHPAISPITLSKPLCGAALLSPWGDFGHSSNAYTRNQYKDSWNGPVLSKCAQTFLGDAKPDEYNQPFHAPASWWSDLPSKVEDILITGGSEEVMVDDIERFAKKIEVSIAMLPGIGVTNSMALDKPHQYHHIGRKRRSPRPSVHGSFVWCDEGKSIDIHFQTMGGSATLGIRLHIEQGSNIITTHEIHRRLLVKKS